jgi:hypothetical protein
VIYLIGALSNPKVPEVANEMRAAGLEVFDNWHAAGPEADREWERYERARGYRLVQALDNYSAWHVFEYDKAHLDECKVGVLMYPCGKSGHLELGYMIGQGKKGYVLLDEEPERWDVMLRFADAVYEEKGKLIRALRRAYGR